MYQEKANKLSNYTEIVVCLPGPSPPSTNTWAMMKLIVLCKLYIHMCYVINCYSNAVTFLREMLFGHHSSNMHWMKLLCLAVLADMNFHFCL